MTAHGQTPAVAEIPAASGAGWDQSSPLTRPVNEKRRTSCSNRSEGGPIRSEIRPDPQPPKWAITPYLTRTRRDGDRDLDVTDSGFRSPHTARGGARCQRGCRKWLMTDFRSGYCPACFRQALVVTVIKPSLHLRRQLSFLTRSDKSFPVEETSRAQRHHRTGGGVSTACASVGDAQRLRAVE